jgi:glycosyltransferase involved in cell wall biosynthesis
MNYSEVKPKVSVIIPAYLPEKSYTNFLEQAVDSCKKQTYSIHKIVIVYNGPITQKIKDTITIDLKSKTSASVARNIGAANCLDSDYFCFLDADDYFHSEKIEKQIKACLENNLDFCFTEAIKVDENNKVLGEFAYRQNAIDTQTIKSILPFDNVLVNSSAMIKKESFLKAGMFCPTNEYKIAINGPHNNANGAVYEDYLLWYNALHNNFSFRKIPEFLTYYRVNTSVAR